MPTEKGRTKVFDIERLLMEIGRAPLLTVEEELALVKAIQEKGPDCNEMERLELSTMRLVVSVANQYANKGLSLEELIELGKEGFRTAAMTFNIDSESIFLSYAVWQIRIEQTLDNPAQQ